MKILIQEPDGPYKCEVDSGVMYVTLKEVFLGVALTTDDGETLHISMRDSGFEIHYTGDFGEKGFDAGWVDFKGGQMTPRGKS